MTTAADLPAPLCRIPMASRTPMERAAGRFMRAPDHPGENEGDGDDNGVDNDGGEDQSGSQSRDTTREADDGDDDGDESEQEDKGASGDDDEDGGERPRRNGYEKRIANLTRRLREAEARADKPTGREADDNKTPTPTGKPKVDDFDTYEEFIEAMADYKAEERFKAREADREAQNAGREFEKRMSAGIKRFRDYDEVVTSDVKIRNSAVAAIRETDDPAGVIYYLAKHADELDAINDLSPAKQALAIGKIEAKLEKDGKGKSTEGTGDRTRTKAPEPINANKGGKGSTEADYDKMSADDFIRARNREVRGGRK